jgi:superoxide dismutase, Fe-Mn family
MPLARQTCKRSTDIMGQFKTTRRDFIAHIASLVPATMATSAVFAAVAKGAGSAIAAPAGTTATASAAAPAGPFKLPPLGYAYDALEPHIDAQTMQIHHDKHHAAYVANLNKAVADHPETASKPIGEIIAHLGEVPEAIRAAVRNNGGGHLNHSFFWELMTPGGAKAPTGELEKAINADLGGMEALQKAFNEAGTKRFGSGWAWMVKDKDGKLKVVSTPNQDSPVSEGMVPVLGNDVWEHAYYLKYQNRRGDYLAAWWNVVNWDKAAANFAAKA